MVLKCWYNAAPLIITLLRQFFIILKIFFFFLLQTKLGFNRVVIIGTLQHSTWSFWLGYLFIIMLCILACCFDVQLHVTMDLNTIWWVRDFVVRKQTCDHYVFHTHFIIIFKTVWSFSVHLLTWCCSIDIAILMWLIAMLFLWFYSEPRNLKNILIPLDGALWNFLFTLCLMAMFWIVYVIEMLPCHSVSCFFMCSRKFSRDFVFFFNFAFHGLHLIFDRFANFDPSKISDYTVVKNFHHIFHSIWHRVRWTTLWNYMYVITPSLLS